MIAVVEDEKELCESLKMLLTEKGYEIVTAGSCGEVDKYIGNPQIDMFLLDVKLPDGSGFDICRKIRKSSEVPVIFLTSCDSEEEIVMGLDIGADDYITKPFYTKELLSRISANLRRSKFNADNIYKKGDIVVDFDRYKISRCGDELNISTNEFDIVRILIENKGRVVRREVIYEKIWDIHGNFVEYNTLTVAMSRIKAKLGTYGEKHQQYIETIRNVGYRWID